MLSRSAALVRALRRIAPDQVTVVAAGVAFYLLLAVFSALAALVSVWGLVSDPIEVRRQIEALPVPPQAGDLLVGQFERIAASPDATLGAGLLAGVLLGLASAARGMAALIAALNLAYRVRETRGFVARTALSLALALAAVAGGVVTMSLVVGVPVILRRLGLGGVLGVLASALPWIVLSFGVMSVLAGLYRFAPDRPRARWRWASPGTVVATVLWVSASVLFTMYVAAFGNFNETYGSVGAVVVLLLWLWLGALATLVGAEVDAETARAGHRGAARP